MIRAEETTQPRDVVDHIARRLTSSGSKDARALRSGRALRKGLLSLLDRKPIEQITIRDICDESGVSYPTFSRHYLSKESLLDEVATDEIAKLNDLTSAVRKTGGLRKAIWTLCTYVNEHRSLWATLLNGGAGPAMRLEWARYSQRAAAQEPPVNSWLPPELGRICGVTLIVETIAWWVAQPPELYSVDEVATILLRLLTTSIMAPD